MAEQTYTAADGSTYATEAELIQHNVYKLRDFLNTLPNDTIRQAVEYPESASADVLAALKTGTDAIAGVLSAKPAPKPAAATTDATTQSELEGAAAKATELSGASQ